MSKIDVIRAWKDETYRTQLSPEERAALPQNPAGPVELSDADLVGAGGLAAAVTESGSWCLCPSRSMCTSCDFSCG